MVFGVCGCGRVDVSTLAVAAPLRTISAATRRQEDELIKRMSCIYLTQISVGGERKPTGDKPQHMRLKSL